jgi:hypothetical protein
VAVVDAEPLTVLANIVDTDLIGPRAVRFTNYYGGDQAQDTW